MGGRSKESRVKPTAWEGSFSVEQTSVQVTAGYAVHRPLPTTARLLVGCGGGQWGGGGVEFGQIICCC